MKRVYRDIQNPMILDAIKLINMRFNQLSCSNSCLGVDYFPREEDDKSIAVKVLNRPNAEDLEFIRLQFQGEYSPKIKFEAIDFNDEYFSVWFTNVHLDIL